MTKANELQDKDSEDNQRYSRATAYENAEYLRKRGLLGNITDNIIAGNSIRGSFKQGISDTLKAKATGLKERLDPINIAKSLTGNLGGTIVGSLLNRSPEDLAYFAGKDLPKRQRGKLGKINTAFYATVVRAQRMRKGESLTDITAKLFAFMKKTNEEKTLQFELDKDFEEEHHDEDKKRHEQLIKAIESTKQIPEKLEQKLELQKKEEQIFKAIESTKQTPKKLVKAASATKMLSLGTSGGSSAYQMTPRAMPSAGAVGPPDLGNKKIEDFIDFTANSGDKDHFQKLNPTVANAFTAMAKEYFETTGKKLQINSSYRSAEEQKDVKSTFGPKASVGHSLHNESRALDLNSEQVQSLLKGGYLNKYGFSTLANDPPHIQRDIDGGLFASASGSKVMPSLDIKRQEEALLFASGSKVKDVDNIPKVGDKINKSSVENQQLKQKSTNNTVIVNNSVTSISGGTTNKQIMSTPAKDIPPTYMAHP
jgi:hypothetical protein